MPPAGSLRERHTGSKAVIAPRQLAGYQNQLNSKSRKKDQDQWTIKQTRRSSETAKINRIDKKSPKKENYEAPNGTKIPTRQHKIIDMAKEKDDLLRHDK